MPSMTIVKCPARGRSTGNRNNSGNNRGGRGGGNDGDWNRGHPRPQNSNNNNSDQWSRGHAPPKNQNQRGRRGGRGNNQPPLFDGPVEPLVKSKNHWRPRKNTSALIVAEKKVKSILNKMTKEKFARLSAQMLEIPILTSEMLSMMIDNVCDKAIDEPAFGDMYADLCVSLSQSVQVNKLVHIIESDEEPPTEDGNSEDPVQGQNSSNHTVFRWSNDLSTSDEQIVGPIDSADACIATALDGEDHAPVERNEMELELVSACIKQGSFIKIMKEKAGDADTPNFYTVYFPVSEAEDLGQQLSGIFLSQLECENDAGKKNSFKRSLLNKCEEEFKKQDIYIDWKKEKKEYEANKGSMSDAERKEKEEEFVFRRIRIKKQMLGNIKFIGQLYKKRLLKEKIMRYCIGSLLKLKELEQAEPKSKNPEYEDSGEMDLDEEDHEAICSMFTTIGLKIDTLAATAFMDVCFRKITVMSNDKSLPSRSRFMYKDLLDLRHNKWVPRRKVEKAKTLEEIRKDVEKEERRQAAESQQANRGGGGYNPRNSGRSGSGYQRQNTGGQRRQPKPTHQPDEDGFTMIGSSKPPQRSQPDRQAKPSMAKPKGETPLSGEDLERAIKRMRSDFLTDGGNVEELMLSMDELSATPRAGVAIVRNFADRCTECKDNERDAICCILTTLFEKERLPSDEFKEGIAEIVSCIGFIVPDAPKAYEYIGEILGIAMKYRAIDTAWLSETLANMEDGDPESVVRCSLLALRDMDGADVKSFCDEQALSSLLGDDKWKAIARDVY